MPDTTKTDEYYAAQGGYIELMRGLNKDARRLVYSHSYGCQQNVADGEKINGQLAEMDFAFTPERSAADLIIFNTCAVRENAENRVFGNVGELKRLKEQKPGLIICLCGCMVQQERVAAGIRKTYPFVDLIFGPHALDRLPELIYKTYNSANAKITDISGQETAVSEGVPIRRDGKYKAWVSVMYGCNNFCSYCIVPYVRGRERSRESGRVLDEIKNLAGQGCREFTLLGQNVNSYKSPSDGLDFPGLIREIQKIEGDFRVRFISSHPKDASPELISAMKDCDKVVRHLHLPVQCGSDRILRAMNRNYTAEQYKKIIDGAREAMPGISFTSDIIVGFPGETYEDFLQTLELVKYVRYNSLFTFIYSKRSGTKAALLDDPVPHSVKAGWMAELLKAQDKIGREIVSALAGSVQRLLVEEKSRSGGGFLLGRTDSNMLCEFEGGAEILGTFANVEITEASNWKLKGKLI
ncbi:MAG: tRNA (N6-isopentenyl adenosine(37)-C2)-methylthiotransferase MiaB [Oscillospiraceae bacterium]|nr:tRNA (N6-isopentenyl adenosine(37)-C2)-methylthiotransferase MiaB [Oscillospiraceae bacterium]